MQRVERRQAKAIGSLKILEELSHQLRSAALGMSSIPLAGQDEEIGANELLGRHDEALAQVQQVYLVDPLAVDSRTEALWIYFFSGRMEETVAQARKTIELEPGAGSAHAILALAYSQMGRRRETVEAAETAARVSDAPGKIVVAVSALARVGERDKAEKLLDRALEMAKSIYVCRFLLAAAYTDLGEKEKALESLERGAREKST